MGVMVGCESGQRFESLKPTLGLVVVHLSRDKAVLLQVLLRILRSPVPLCAVVCFGCAYHRKSVSLPAIWLVAIKFRFPEVIL